MLTIQNNIIVFQTLERYLKTTEELLVDFAIQKNRLFPLKALFQVLGTNTPDGKTPSGIRSKTQPSGFGWYPPLAVIFKVDDPRPYRILQSHYRGISTAKAKLQVAYFALLKKGWLKEILIPAYVLIRPKAGDRKKIVKTLGGMVFGGSGSKVKIFKFNEGKVVNLLKTGYDDCFLLKEITVRRNFQDVLPIPKLLDSNWEAKLFEEEYIPATPLRELNMQTWPLLRDLFEKLFGYYRQNKIVSISVDEYQNLLLREIKEKTSSLPLVTQKTLSEFVSRLNENWIHDPKAEIILVQGHGDFWLGNILRKENDKRLLIVDWERSAQYSLMYDLFTLFSIHSMEQRNLELIKSVLALGTNCLPLKDILRKYQEQFSFSYDRSWVKLQLRIFLMEKISSSLRLFQNAPFTGREAQDEMAKWNTFLSAILKNRMLTDSF